MENKAILICTQLKKTFMNRLQNILNVFKKCFIVNNVFFNLANVPKFVFLKDTNINRFLILKNNKKLFSLLLNLF